MRFPAVRKLFKRLIPRSLVRYRGPAVGRKVALTFDDGPHEGLTPRVLRTLRERGRAATFFVIGEKAETCPDLLRVMKGQGCELGNHSYSHADFKRLGRSEMSREVERADEVIRAATGAGATYFRPPRGSLSVGLLWQLYRRRMLPALLWSVQSSHEYLKTRSEILQDLGDARIAPGDIVLLHDPSPNTAEALPAILDLFEERGLEPVTLEELFGRATPGEKALPAPARSLPCSNY